MLKGWNSAFGFFKKLTGKGEPANNNSNANTESLDYGGSSSPQ